MSAQIAGLIAGAAINNPPMDNGTVMIKVLTSFNVWNGHHFICLVRLNSLNQLVFF